jgi:hypothetical protein
MECESDRVIGIGVLLDWDLGSDFQYGQVLSLTKKSPNSKFTILGEVKSTLRLLLRYGFSARRGSG